MKIKGHVKHPSISLISKFIPSKWFQVVCWSGHRAPWICLAQSQSRSPGKVDKILDLDIVHTNYKLQKWKRTIFDTSSMERCFPGMAGTPVMKSWVLQVNVKTGQKIALPIFVFIVCQPEWPDNHWSAAWGHSLQLRSENILWMRAFTFRKV